MITPKVFTVSQLNAHIGSMIATDPALQVIFIEGELSNVRLNNQSGHLYFSLKDSKSVVRAVMFSWSVKNLRFRPDDVMKVIMRAQVTVYEPMGQNAVSVGAYQVMGVPTCFIISHGEIVARVEDPSQLQATVAKYM